MSLLAMIWNYIYNLLFDYSLKALNKPLHSRGFLLRSFHAIFFELGFMLVSIPAVMIFMGYTFLQAIALDIGFLIAVPIYTFIYNLMYDQVFPVPTTRNYS